MYGKSQGPPANGASLDRFLMANLYKLGDWKTAESWSMLNFFWSESFKILFKCGSFLFIRHRVTESQSHRVTESQTLKGTQYTGEIFCA